MGRRPHPNSSTLILRRPEGPSEGWAAPAVVGYRISSSFETPPSAAPQDEEILRLSVSAKPAPRHPEPGALILRRPEGPSRRMAAPAVAGYRISPSFETPPSAAPQDEEILRQAASQGGLNSPASRPRQTRPAIREAAMPKLTIVICADHAHVNGGQAKVALDSALGLAAAGARVIFFSACGPVDQRLAAGVETVCLDQKDILANPSRLDAARQGILERHGRKSARRDAGEAARREQDRPCPRLGQSPLSRHRQTHPRLGPARGLYDARIFPALPERRLL